ncbi:type VI secretion system membrane subunit TssM [Pseudomonas sp. TNT2022 ID1044]|uniref:type VI secretion system membrane subunit TssM n=1 Tax=Pseudomonas sp. TNT2022 ID1044 TaxID=2942636 RepID=UPI002360D73B|nr:type VI secretion system membrane subunit TssM [Pseudomonas sp. TNT2022 ID1044]MDD0999670.1 type VI secretion system membrane subunit TssM [Pseudomonas sp. TNT2022 ID1044]
MKNLFGKTAAFLRKTWVWSLLSILLTAVFVWLVGPLLAIDDFRFWESPTSRLLSISVLFLVWGLAMVFVSWRTGIREQAEGRGLGVDRLLREQQIDEERADLRARFKAAVKVLKTSSFYRNQRERGRRDLPWYLLIGPQGSGKTTLLNVSGLEFPLNNLDRKSTDESPGTRSCDWYFAEGGVFIDTPGRYLNQPDADIDAGGWATLLALLRKRRRHRPLNGVLVTLPVQTLLSHDGEALQMLARHVRARLQEVRQKLHIELPVYLVLSKADEQSGFNEFFDQLTREESDHVLGVSLSKDLGSADASAIRVEFEALLHRLDSQVIMRMHQERDPLCRGRILDYPHQLGLLGEGLCQFIEMAFCGHRSQGASTFRGFYLTSATRPGKPLAYSGVNNAVLTTPLMGHPRFISHLFSRIIFPEADTVQLDKREHSLVCWGQRTLYMTSLAALSLFGLWWAGGFSANHERLENLRTLAQAWTLQRSALPPQGNLLPVLQNLDAIHAATQAFPQASDVSYRERGGLYQGEAANPAIMSAYERELETHLLPSIASLLEDQIRTQPVDRERLLNSLRAYLMLSLKDRRDVIWLKDWIASDWSRRYAANNAVQSRLSGHLDQLLSQSFSYPLNDPLVAQARQILRSESLANVVYRVLREQARALPDYHLNQHLGPQGDVFVGTRSLIPGFYTLKGYQQYFSVKGAALVTDILRDNWVLGESSQISAMDLRHLMVELEQLYFRDYANVWGDAIARIALQPIEEAGEGAEQLASLTSASSPVLQLLAQIRENTRIPSIADSVDDAAASAQQLTQKSGGLGSLAVANVKKASGTLAGHLPDTARKAMQRRFEPLHRLLDDDNGPSADLTAVLHALNELQLQLTSLARAGTPDLAAYEMAKARMGNQRDALSILRTASGRLPRPAATWFNTLAEDSWRLVLNDAYRFVNQRYQSELYSFYGKSINKRYPFNAHSASDVALSDFREFFKAQGLVERFFDNYMRPFVSGNPGSYRLKTVDGRSLPVSRFYLDQMASAHVIRQSFFAEDPSEPQVRFKLEPYSLDPTVSRAEFRFGDRTMEYRHGPIMAASFKWPVEAEDGRTSLVLDRMVGRPIGIEKNKGPWSLFRLLDLMQTESLIGRDVLVLKADVGGLRANYLLMSQRTPNPFDMGVLRTFRMPMQL